ncbi:MAG: hypothetical protein K2H85_10845, partial [Allobaculum sp.]|nr:hypothetical protein [Allobaculum sp.]
CENCGTPLAHDLSSMSSPSNFQDFNTPHSYVESNSSPSSSSKHKKWIIWGVGLAIFLCLGGGVYFLSSYLSKDKENDIELEKQEERIVVKFSEELPVSQDPDESLNETENTLKVATDTNETIKESEKSISSVSEDLEIVVASNSIQLNPIAESLIASNYSGAACAVMALSVQDISASQRAIGNQLGLDEGKISDYRDLTNLMNQLLSAKGSSLQYVGSYSLLDDTTAEEKMEAYNLFLKRIDQDLTAGKALLMVIGESPDGLLQRNSYALIYGKDEEAETYTIMIPYTDEARSYEVDLKTLADMFAAPEAFCYLY